MNRLGYFVILFGLLGLVRPVSSEEENLGRMRGAIEILRRLPSGSEILRKAQTTWGEASAFDLLKRFRWGRASKTDAVITRHYNPQTGEERRERQVFIFLRADQSLEEIVMDMAHELVHATSRPGWDPYDPRLTPASYIQVAIDGEGGEVDALLVECRVSFEMSDQFGTSSERCARYLGSAGNAQRALVRESVRKDFYRVGKWRPVLEEKLGKDLSVFPLLSTEAPKLFSSTGQAPYPVALFQEYEAITEVACENTRKRVQLAKTREPASVPMELFLKQRCGYAQAR